MQADLSIRYTDEIRTSKHAKRQFRELAHRAIEAADLGEGCAVHAQATRQGTTYTFAVEVTEPDAEAPRTLLTHEGFPLGGAGSDEAFEALCATLGFETPAPPAYEALEQKLKAARAAAQRKAQAGGRVGGSGRRGASSGMSASRGSGPNPRQRHRPTGG